MIIMVPILLPLVVAAGMDPVHFGIIVAINLTLGMITPPVGICLFIGSTIAKVPLERVAWATLPFLLVSIVILYIITFSPGLVMWLPGVWAR
jgi:C4-dicarboxylate transporter, DctM subunit